MVLISNQYFLHQSVCINHSLTTRTNWTIGESISRLIKRTTFVLLVCRVNCIRNRSRHWHNRIAISVQVDVSRTKREARVSAKSASVARSGKDDLRTRTLNLPHIGDPQEISGIGSCLYERRTHTFDRDGKTCSGAMAQLGTFEGITREKGHSVSLSCATTLCLLPSLLSAPPPSLRSVGRYHCFTVGWLPKIRDEGGSGHRQREFLL